MTQEELDFLFVTQLDNSISIKYEVLRNLTQPVFEQYKAIHNKYQENIKAAQQPSEAPAQDSANGKKAKKKVDANI